MCQKLQRYIFRSFLLAIDKKDTATMIKILPDDFKDCDTVMQEDDADDRACQRFKQAVHCRIA